MEHINTFNKGQNTDSTLIYQPDGTYRYNKNFQLTSYDNNHWALEDRLGNRMLVKINQRYLSVTSALDISPTILGAFSFIDKMIVHSTSDDSAGGGYGEIGEITFAHVENKMTATYLPLYHSIDLKYSKRYMIGNEGFCFRETNNMEGNYWTDDFNEPRVINVKNPIFKTYIASGSLSATAGKKYMVLQGAITYNGVKYGPGLTAGNVFTTTGGIVVYTLPIGTPLVIEYYPFELFAWTPSRSLANHRFDSYGSGSVTCGNKIYFTRLSVAADGFSTNWSYGSFPTHVGTSNSVTAVSGSAFDNFVGANGTASTKSVKINVQNIDTNFDTIEMCCAEFDSSMTTPTKISIVTKATITGSQMILEHLGSVNLGTVTLEELTLFPASILTVGTMTTNKNFNVIGKLTERPELDFDFKTNVPVLSSFEYPMAVHGDVNSCSNGQAFADVSPTVAANPAPGTIHPFSHYMVTGTTGVDYVTYNGNNYGPGQVLGNVFKGVGGVGAYATTGTPVIRPCTALVKYLDTLGNPVYNASEIKTGFWNYKDPTVHENLTSYWSQEKYRIGLLARDKKGNPYYVRHLGDITMPDIYAKGGLITGGNFGGVTEFFVNPSGITINNIVIPAAIASQIGSFEIVRCERDARILAQGLVWQICNDAGTPDVYFPNCCTQNIVDKYSSANDYNSFICPDWLVGQNTIPGPLNKSENSLEEAFWLYPNDFGGANYHRFDGVGSSGAKAFYSKFIQPLTKDGAYGTRTRKWSLWKEYDEATYDVDFDGSGKDFDNRLHTGGATILDPDYACLGSGPYPLANHGAVGGKKIVFKISNFLHYGSVSDYPAGSEDTNPRKILMNVVNAKSLSELYGGNSDTALAQSLYINTGHFQEINSTVLATVPVNGNGDYVFDGVQIMGGDCFVNFVDYGYGIFDDATSEGSPNSFSYGIVFPCENTTNYDLRRGRKATNSRMFYPGTADPECIVWNDGSGNTRLEDYSYNPGYSADGNFIKYPALPVNFTITSEFEARTRYSQEKFPGELTNSFRVFALADKKDLDGQSGKILNLRTKDGKTFSWQHKGIDYLPIGEHQSIPATNGEGFAVGTGGVIPRFDVIDTYFGNQHKHGMTAVEDGWIWFDMRRRAFMHMGSDGGRPTEISLKSGWQAFFNTTFVQNAVAGSESLIYDTDTPLMGIGITGTYDPKFKCAYLTFKWFYSNNAVVPATKIRKDFTVVYNALTGYLVGFIDSKPAFWYRHDDMVLSVNDPKAESYFYGAGMPSTTFTVGMTVNENNIEYICISPVTIASYPGTATQVPAYPGSTYWAQINETKEIYIDNEIPVIGTRNYNFFYGKVWSNELEVVINPKAKAAFSVDTISREQNANNFTDIYYETSDQTAQDLDIKSWNRDYNYKKKMWDHNVPFSSKGRLVDDYLKAKFVKKNYDTDPRVPLNLQVVIAFIASTVRERL